MRKYLYSDSSAQPIIGFKAAAVDRSESASSDELVEMKHAASLLVCLPRWELPRLFHVQLPVASAVVIELELGVHGIEERIVSAVNRREKRVDGVQGNAELMGVNGGQYVLVMGDQVAVVGGTPMSPVPSPSRSPRR